MGPAPWPTSSQLVSQGGAPLASASPFQRIAALVHSTQSGYLSFLEADEDNKDSSSEAGEARRKSETGPRSPRRLSAQAAATGAAGGTSAAISAAASASVAGGSSRQAHRASSGGKSKAKRAEANKVTEEQAKIKFLLKTLRFLR